MNVRATIVALVLGLVGCSEPESVPPGALSAQDGQGGAAGGSGGGYHGGGAFVEPGAVGAAGGAPGGGTGGAVATAPCATLAIPVRIMPAGDSITCGTDGRGGYRAPLLAALSALAPVEFVGPRDPSACGGPGNHAGYPGVTPANFGGPGHLEAFLPPADPDVVLYHLGTNSDGTGAAGYVASVVRPTLAWKASVRVVVALIVSSPCCAAAAASWNADVAAAVRAEPEFGSRLFLADLSGVSAPAEFGADGLHPSIDGYAHMAALWLASIQDRGLLCAR